MKHLQFKARWEDTPGVNQKIDDATFCERWIRDVLFGACEAAGAHVRESVSHQFYPRGITSVVILSESHAVVSGWVKERFALFDYFSCSASPCFEIFIDYVRKRHMDIDDESIEIKDR